jgi:hypothetical protein
MGTAPEKAVYAIQLTTAQTLSIELLLMPP